MQHIYLMKTPPVRHRGACDSYFPTAENFLFLSSRFNFQPNHGRHNGFYIYSHVLVVD